MNKKHKIVVLGAGINGLCTTLKLLQSGHDVSLFSQNFSPNTWSNSASAVWMQFKAEPIEKVKGWLYSTYDWCQKLEKDVDAGIDLLNYCEYHIHQTEHPYFLHDIERTYQPLPKKALLHFQAGYQSTLYRLDSNLLLPYLLKQIHNYDCEITQGYVRSLYDSTLDDYSIIINCTGAATHLITEDKQAFPISGQYILIEKIKNLNTIHFCIVNDEKYIAIVPRRNDVWLGGSAYMHSWDKQIKSDLTDFIIQQCIEIAPEIKQQKILKVDVAFRSGRTQVRVEKEHLNDGRIVIHNYGHGGSAFSLCWGCANEVKSILDSS